MARAFIFLNLSAAASFSYHQPVLEWVKKTFPGTPTFDLDSASGNQLVAYAVRMLEEAGRPVVFIYSPEEVPLGKVTPLLEAVIRSRPKCLVLLHGNHPRLQRMLAARPDLPFLAADREEPLRERIDAFWQEII